jgi:YesN/AraC family two-component response regulator
MALGKVLLVDDDELLRLSLATVLRQHEFEVTSAANVPEALKCISSNDFDILLTDLHMPGAGDGLTVVSAMRHANPKAVTILLSSFPEMDAAAHAILLQTDEILVKPMPMAALINTIIRRLERGPGPSPEVESVATILERSAVDIISDWYDNIETEQELMAIPMTKAERCSHLPQMFLDLVTRLHSPKGLGTKELRSVASEEHGKGRRRQGYSAAMLVEESRQLQVSIFRALQANMKTIDFSVVLLGVMTIADEVDSQLSQAMSCYIAESEVDALPA